MALLKDVEDLRPRLLSVDVVSRLDKELPEFDLLPTDFLVRNHAFNPESFSCGLLAR